MDFHSLASDVLHGGMWHCLRCVCPDGQFCSSIYYESVRIAIDYISTCPLAIPGHGNAKPYDTRLIETETQRHGVVHQLIGNRIIHRPFKITKGSSPTRTQN